MPTRDDQKERIQQATDIVRLIGEQIALRPRGKEHVGLCPFHDDSSPSLYVSPVKQIYKCFSCGAGGDAFSFVVNYHKMTFPEALRYLAERAGIELEAATSTDRARGDRRQRIADANAHALEWFRQQLQDADTGRAARAYIEQRGIHPEMVASFQLGYAPDAWDALARQVARKRWDVPGFLDAGLIAERRRDTASPPPSPPPSPQHCYDRLRHRLVFPIFDAIGRPIAFGGRVLPGTTRDDSANDAKYLNSPENALFNKSATLYGIHLAKKPIIDTRTAVIVEGYTDVIACHQAAPGGAANVVATLGTALTHEHVSELRRYAEKVVLVFDADTAGQNAADRAVELFLAGEMDVGIAILPDGLDPADLLAQEDGYERWCAVTEQAEDALSYQFQRIGEQLAAAGSLTGRQQVAETYIARLAQLGLARTSPVRRAMVVQPLAELLRMSESAVSELLAAAARRAAPRRTPGDASEAAGAGTEPLPAGTGAAETDGGDSDNASQAVAFAPRSSKLKAVRTAERHLIGCLLRDNALFHHTLPDGRSLDEAIAPAELLTPEGRELYQRIYHHLSEGGGITLAPLLAELTAASSDEAEGNQLAALATRAEDEVDRAARDEPRRLTDLCVSAAEAILSYHREQDHLSTKRQWQNIDDETEKERQAQRLLEGLRQPSPARIARPPTS